MKSTELDLYTDYLLSSFGAATATWLSQMVDGAVSHDKVTRFLSGRDYTSKDLWMQVKGVIRQVEVGFSSMSFKFTPVHPHPPVSPVAFTCSSNASAEALTTLA